jgi:type II secretion system protein C
MTGISMIYLSNLIGSLQRRGISSRHLIRSGEAVLVIVLAISLAELAWDLVPLPDQAAVFVDNGRDVSGSLQPSNTEGMPQGKVSPALKSMFGTVDYADQAIDVTGPVQETRLDLTLKGIIADNASGNRLALIARGGMKEEIYRVGDEIEGAEIMQIGSRRVLIRRNGVTEALNLEIQKLTESKPVGDNSGYTRNGVRKVGDYERVVSQQALRQQLKNLPQLLQQARTVPHIEDGVQAGFRVVGIQSGSVFADLGIEQEDVIRSVNGTPVRTVEEALNAYRSLRTQTAFQVDLLRQGREVTINFSIQ